MTLLKRILLPFSALLALCSCSGVDVLNMLVPRSGYTVVRDIAYGEEKRQKLDIYLPEKPAPGHPVMLFFYGGSWQTGSKDDYRFAAQAFVSKGYTTVLADYRLYPEVYFPDFMTDGARAFSWVHAHIGEYGGNANNLFLSGHSSGGYIAVMLTVNPVYIEQAGGKREWIKGTIGIAGPYDFLPFTDPKIRAIFSKLRERDSQPINYVAKGVPPLLLAHGDADTQVLPRNTYNLAAKLETFGDPVEKVIYPGVAHIGIVLSLANGFRGKTTLLEDIDRFVRAHQEP